MAATHDNPNSEGTGWEQLVHRTEMLAQALPWDLARCGSHSPTEREVQTLLESIGHSAAALTEMLDKLVEPTRIHFPQEANTHALKLDQAVAAAADLQHLMDALVADLHAIQADR